MKKTTSLIAALIIATFIISMFAIQSTMLQAQPAKNKRAPAPTPSPVTVKNVRKKPKWYPNEVEGEAERSKHPRRRNRN